MDARTGRGAAGYQSGGGVDEGLLRAVIGTIPVGVVIADESGDFKLVSKAVYDIWGGAAPNPESPDRYNVYEAWWADSGERISAEEWALSRAVTRGESSVGERIDIRRFDGTRGTILNSAVPLHDGAGRIIGGVAVLQDITDHQRTLNELRETTLHLQWLLRATQAFEASSMLDVARILCEVTADATKHERIVLSTYDPGTQAMTVVHTTRSAPPDVGVTWPLDMLSPQLQQSIEEGCVSVLDFSDRSIPPEDRAWADILDMHLTISIPLVVGDGLVGHISVDEGGERRPFGRRDIEIAQAIAAQGASALETVRLREKEREIARLGEALDLINLLLHSTLTTEQVMTRVLADAAAALAVEGATWATFEDDAWTIRAAFGMPEELEGRVLHEDAATLLAELRRTGAPVHVHDTSTDPRAHQGMREAFGDTSLLIVPLKVHGRLTGALGLHSRGHAVQMSTQAVEFASRLAASVSLALENATLYRKEHSIARMLQHSILPRPIPIPSLEVAHVYVAASDEARVGGDFYDIFQLDHGLVGVTVGDVSGKGLAAGALAQLARNAVRSFATEKYSTPADVVAKTNLVVIRESSTEEFLTLFFGIFDRRNGRLTYCNAGHTSPILRRHDGRSDQLPANGPLVGVMENAAFLTDSVRVHPGDAMYLFTDGIPESRRTGEMLGESGLTRLIEDFEEEPLVEVVAHVLQSVIDYAGGAMRDDAAVLAFRWTGEPHDTAVQQTLDVSG